MLTYVREAINVNFNVNWKSLEDAGIAKDTQITLDVRDVSYGRLLDLILDQVNGGKDKLSRVYWVIDDGVVTIATGNALNEQVLTKVVDISDLLHVTPNFSGPVMDLSNTLANVAGNGSGGSGGGSGLFQGNQQGTNTNTDTDSTNMAEARQKLRDTIMESIKGSIGDDMWKPDGKGSISIVGSKMVISQTLLGFKLMEMSNRHN